MFYNGYDNDGYFTTNNRHNFETSIDTKTYNKSVKTSEILKSIRNFCGYIAENTMNYIDKKTYDILLQRYVSIRDLDDKDYFQSYSFNGGTFRFILSTNDKLIYPQDVCNILNVPFYFKNTIPEISKLNPDCPVYIEKYDEYTATIRQLGAQDIVVDTDMNQIYPTITNNPPVALINLFKKRKEIIK